MLKETVYSGAWTRDKFRFGLEKLKLQYCSTFYFEDYSIIVASMVFKFSWHWPLLAFNQKTN